MFQYFYLYEVICMNWKRFETILDKMGVLKQCIASDMDTMYPSTKKRVIRCIQDIHISLLSIEEMLGVDFSDNDNRKLYMNVLQSLNRIQSSLPPIADDPTAESSDLDKNSFTPGSVQDLGVYEDAGNFVINNDDYTSGLFINNKAFNNKVNRVSCECDVKDTKYDTLKPSGVKYRKEEPEYEEIDDTSSSRPRIVHGQNDFTKDNLSRSNNTVPVTTTATAVVVQEDSKDVAESNVVIDVSSVDDTEYDGHTVDYVHIPNVSKKEVMRTYGTVLQKSANTDYHSYKLNQCTRILNRWFQSRFPKNGCKIHFKITNMNKWIESIIAGYAVAIQNDTYDAYEKDMNDWCDRLDRGEDISYMLPYSVVSNSNSISVYSYSTIPSAIFALRKSLWRYYLNQFSRYVIGEAGLSNKYQINLYRSILKNGNLSQDELADLKSIYYDFVEFNEELRKKTKIYLDSDVWRKD